MKETILYYSVFVGNAYKWAVKQREMMKLIMWLYFQPCRLEILEHKKSLNLTKKQTDTKPRVQISGASEVLGWLLVLICKLSCANWLLAPASFKVDGQRKCSAPGKKTIDPYITKNGSIFPWGETAEVSWARIHESSLSLIPMPSDWISAINHLLHIYQ